MQRSATWAPGWREMISDKGCSWLSGVAIGSVFALVVGVQPAYAQQHPRFEAHLGAAYLDGHGIDVSDVRGMAVDGGVAFWFRRSVGMAVTVVYGPHADRADATGPWAGRDDRSLKLASVTVRYRWWLGESMNVDAGVGLGYGSHLVAGQRYVLTGYSVELLIARKLGSTFGVNGGLCIDALGADGAVLRPSINATVSF